MPSVPTTGSSNIAVLDSRIIADLCSGIFYIDATPSVYIGSGAENVYGANVQIKDPTGVIIKPYGSNYEIAPGLSGGMDAVIAFNVPTIAGGYQTGNYTISVQLFDEFGNWTVTKTVKVCSPDKNKTQRKYGSLSAKLDADCKNGKLYVVVDTPPNHQGKTVESQTNDFTLEYPTSSELDPLETEFGNFSVQLYEGVYKITGEICATYNMGDNVYINIKYKVKREKNARCLIDLCCVYNKLDEIGKKVGTECTQAEKDEVASVILDAIRLLTTIELGANCGEDPSAYIDELEQLLGCTCTCNCAEGTPVIGTSPSSDVLIDGCNVEKNVVGNTSIYTINNYEYLVEVSENGGVLVAAAPTVSDCVKTQVLTFNINTAYSQIKGLADQNSTEQAAWAAIINKTLDGITSDCIESGEWDGKTLAERVQLLADKFCSCCGCDAGIETVNFEENGNDITLIIAYKEDVPLSTQVFIDGILVGILLYPQTTLALPGYADGIEHTYTIIPICSNGDSGTPITSTFQFLACPDIAPAVVTESLVEDAVCPFDLTSLEGAPPLGITYEWHNENDHTNDSLVPDPENISSGIFYVFAKNTDGCYSMGTKVTVICDVEASCTAPQNLTVAKNGLGSFVVMFQSAAYPPPGNSYTVKRKLASDPDVPGSYTTLTTPVWNAGISRWVTIDNTAVTNVLYDYVAYSNCGDSPATTPSVEYQYALLSCPALSLTATSDTVSYSFIPPGGDVDQIRIELYNEDETILISQDSYTPAFSNPQPGTFIYLDPSTTYKVKFHSFIGDVESACLSESITTDPAP